MHKRIRKSHFLMGLIVLSVMLCASLGVARGQDALPIEMKGGWQPGPDTYHPSRVIVRFSDAFTTNNAVDSIQQLGYSVYRVADFEPTAAFPSGVRFGIVELPEEVSPDVAIFRLGDAPGILYAERDYIRYKDQVQVDAPIIPNDAHFDKMWGLHNKNCQHIDPHLPGSPVDDADIDAPEAWAVHTGTVEVIVAVIDTGCYIDHLDLADNIWVNEAEMNGEPGVDDDGNGYIDDFWGWDFFHDDNTVFDPNERTMYGHLNDEHGTHCAGTIGALSNNGKGVVGINWNAKIMPLKFIGPEGGYTSHAILALQYAADKGAQVASCSWGGGGHDQSLKDAIEACSMLVVCAAGNTGDNTDVNPHYPSSYDSENIISVAAMMQNEMPCQYTGWWSTCYGLETVDLFAPGGYILSTIPPDPPPTEPGEAYAFFYGTSMATPHVSGAASLLRSLYPDIPLYRTPSMGEGDATIKDMILDSVEILPQYEGKVLTGGRLNLADALVGGGVPIITSIEATPERGRPPLVVSFRATAETSRGEIVDKWWDFGDASEAVREWETTHTYEKAGLYDASFHVLSTVGFESSKAVRIDVFFSPPVIKSISANPWAGSAPLTVQFTAVAEDIDGKIVTTEWDFGDGSDPVTGTLTPRHSYEADGEYVATLTVVDDDGVTAEDSIGIVVADLPEARVDTAEFYQTMRAHRQRTETCTVANIGQAVLKLTAEAYTSGVPDADDVLDVLGSGGDAFGYMWRDSDEPDGPDFDWVEISAIGTKLATLINHETTTIDLPWEFPFYGQTWREINVNANGWVNFGAYPQSPGPWVNGSPIPHPSPPNNLLAVYWDNLRCERSPAGSGVYCHHDEPADRFIVQFNRMVRVNPRGEYTFQVILHPDGTIDYQYLKMYFGGELNERRGTIGIENSDGTKGLQVLHNTAGYMRDGLAIRFEPYRWLKVKPQDATIEPGESISLDILMNLLHIGSGALDGGIIVETNDIRKPRAILPVHIEVIPNNPPAITGCAVNPDMGPTTTEFQFVAGARDADGHIADKWWDFGDHSESVHEFVATHTYSREGEFVATFTAVDNDGYEATASVTVTVCEPASASWNPKQFSFTLGGGQTAADILTLSNVGTGALVFGRGESPGQAQMSERAVALEGAEDLNAEATLGPHSSDPGSRKSEWLPENVGSVIKSWTCPAPIGYPWGVGVLFDCDEIVVTDGTADPTIDYVVTSDGEYAGRSWSAGFGGPWSGDMTFDGTCIWQINLDLGKAAIYKIHPANGQIVGSIRNGTWASTDQRALAYNANDDTFYIGGWYQDIIYKIKGESWDDPGAVIEQWSMPVTIAGLAYHPVADVLIISSSTCPDMIYFVNATTHETMAQFPHPAAGEFMALGCDLARDGNLWISSSDENKMYLVETGLGTICADEWLSWTPRAGSVSAGGSVPITVAVNSEKLDPGVHRGSVVLATNDIENPMIIVPVTATVAGPPVITEASAEPTFGEPPLEVTFHAAFEVSEIPVVSYRWDFGDRTFSSGLDTMHTYTEPGKYTATFSVADQMGARDEASFDIEVKWLPRATCETETIQVTLPPRGSAAKTVALGNVEGNAELKFEVKVRNGGAPTVAMPKRIGVVTDENAKTAEGLYAAIDPELVERIAASIEPGAVGDVIASWLVPSQIALPWGVGFDGSVWISDPTVCRDHLVTPFGEHTGKTFDTAWAGVWPADMAYDANRRLMWQVNVGGDNGIYGLDIETGAVVMKITSGTWTDIPQRGLAYRAEDDTFYIGGWNEDIIYHINGPSHSNPGSVIAAYTFPVCIAGLAWHPNGILWASSNGEPDMIFGLDLDALEVVHQFPHPYGGDYSGAGLTLNSDGNLWVSSQGNRYMYLINTEMPLARGITVDPERGRVVAGETAELEVTINAEELGEPGRVVKQHLEIATNDPENAFLYVDLIINIEAGPAIVETTATPEIGQPPLRVAFAATVEPGAKPIANMWWDFGDGSDPVREAATEHIYTDLGEYEAVFHAIDENEVEATAELPVTVKWLPVLGVEPEEFDEVVQVGEEEQTILTVSNTGVAPMNFEISAAPSFAGSPEWMEYIASEPTKGDYASEPRGYAGAGAGGPDQFGYVWIDTNHAGGPQFDWVEISDVGTRLPLTDESIAEVNLPFAFPFYGDLKTKVRVCSNGYLMFGTGSSVWTNAPIPDPSNLNDLIAVFWADLDPSRAGNVYYYHDQKADRFIVEYQAVPRYNESGDYTFQAILYPDGTIIFQYLEMTGDATSATVGIQDATGADGLQAVYNAPYIADGLAIGIRQAGSILKVNPRSGYLVPGGSQDIQLTLGSSGAAYGTYSLYLYVSADDPYRPFATIPVTLKINASPTTDITAPAGGETWIGKQEIKWTATDSDDPADALTVDLYWSRDGGEWHEIAKGLANTGSYMWNTASVGLGGDAFRVRIVATDPAGQTAEIISEPFTIINDAPMAAFNYSPSPATVTSKVEFVDESTDDGEITAWRWEFGDGAESSERNPKHQYSSKGEFTVKLTVTDNGGLTGVCEKQIQVVNVAPTVKILRPEAGETWTRAREIEYEASDPDGDPLTIKLEYDYLGDEAGWQLIADGQENTGKYLWDISKLAKGGRYKVRVTAADPDGGTAEAVSGEFTIIVLKHMVMAAPNPARNSVTFYYDIESDATIYVYDVVGRLVYSAELAAGTNAHEWNLTTNDRPVAAGLYLYAVVTTDGTKSEVGRLVIER